MGDAGWVEIGDGACYTKSVPILFNQIVSQEKFPAKEKKP
jgi:hypothetical protein